MKRWAAVLISFLLLYSAAVAEDTGTAEFLPQDAPAADDPSAVAAPDGTAVLDLLVPADDDLMETALAAAYNA